MPTNPSDQRRSSIEQACEGDLFTHLELTMGGLMLLSPVPEPRFRVGRYPRKFSKKKSHSAEVKHSATGKIIT
jgi:hypothetical protein